MKKILIVFMMLIGAVAYGQNTFKYEIRANGGLRVGGSTFAEIDSITLQAGKLRIISGATLQKIAGHVLYTDTTTMLIKYARKASPVFSGIAKLNTDTLATQAYARANGGGSEAVDTTHLSSRIDLKLNVSDTSAMLENYALLSEVGSGASMVYPSGSGIPTVVSGSSWGTTITNNSTEWNKAGVVGNGTAPPYFDGSSDGGQILTFYGDNGFWTALQGGAPVANRSYRLPIAALPGTGTTSLMNIDEYGNMGFAFNGIPATLTATELGYSDGVTSSIQNQLNAKVNASDTAAMLAHYALLSEIGTGGDISTLETRVDSIVDVLADSINIETLLQIDFDTDTVASLSDVRSLAGTGVVGVTLNSGTLTLTGSDATADDITFYTNGDGQYDLPAGGGNLTIMSQVQGWISDTADVLRAEMGSVQTSSTYYVSNTGSDTADGLTPATAWQTISKVNGSSFLPGDKILFKSEDTWRETLNIPSGGTVSDYITFGSYGTGDKPKILGSTEITTWTQSSGNVWYSYNAAYIDPYSLSWDANIYFKELNGDISWGNVKKDTWSNLAAEYDWAWTLDTLYIYSATDPNSTYTSVEMSQRTKSISINSKEYVIIDGLECAYGGSAGIEDLYNNPMLNLSGLIIKNCHLHHFGIKVGAGYGVNLWHSDMLIQNNVIHDCGRRGISVNLGEAGGAVSNIIIENNTLYHGFHTTGVDLASSSTSTIDSVIIRNNLIYDDLTETLDGVESIASLAMYLAETSTGEVTNIYIYNNLIKNVTGGGILLDNELTAYIYNNTFYGVNPNQTGNGFLLITDTSTGIVKNNIFYSNADKSTSNFRCVATSTTATIVSDYNLFYASDATSDMIEWNNGVYRMTTWNNYKSASGQDAHSPTPSDPLFVSSSNYELKSGSPAIDNGTNLGIPTDYLGNIRVGSYDIGAYERQLNAIENYISVSDTALMLTPYLTEDRARVLDSDTIPLFVFGLGSGHSSDTAIFNNGRLAGAFYNSGSDTLYVTELRGVLVEGTGTETIDVQVSWDANMKDATPTNLNTIALTVTSMTTGTVDTTFDNNGIPPDTWVWCTLSGASSGNKPTMLILTMTGYRRNRSY